MPSERDGAPNAISGRDRFGWKSPGGGLLRAPPVLRKKFQNTTQKSV